MTPAALDGPAARQWLPRTVADYERMCRTVLTPAEWAARYGDYGDPNWSTYSNNRDALSAVRLRPRVLAGLGTARLSTTIQGTAISHPLVVGPTGTHAAGEVASVRAAGAAGGVFVLSSLSASPADDVAAAAVGPWFQQVFPYRDRAVTRFQVETAARLGASAIVLTVSNTGASRHHQDSAWAAGITPATAAAPAPNLAHFPGRRYTPAELVEMIDPELGWDDIGWLGGLSPLPLVIKGIQAPEDAELAARHGAAGIVVSNHGGRALQGAIGTLDALPDIVAAVSGRIEIHLDGGIRSGEDALKALALGARTVWLGRAARWGEVAAGEAGMRHVLELLKNELAGAMGLCGVRSAADVPPSLVWRPGQGRA
jgi:4-hydroxymandelate oxidase